ncbi:MAG: hypothetical protein U0871_17590 [Gemmataceae bacterium]
MTPTIDLTGLTATDIRLVEELVFRLRQTPPPQPPVDKPALLKWSGTVIGPLTREEMYDDDN